MSSHTPDVFTARRWQWYLDHQFTQHVPIFQVLEETDVFRNPRPRQRGRVITRSPMPSDINDALIRMAVISRHLGSRGHKVRDWTNMRLRLNDFTLSGTPGLMRIEARLTLRQLHIMDDRSGSGIDALEEVPERFLSSRLSTGHGAKERAEATLYLLEHRPRHHRQDEYLTLKVKLMSRKINQEERARGSGTCRVKAYRLQVEKWDRLKSEQPGSDALCAASMELEVLMKDLKNDQPLSKVCWRDQCSSLLAEGTCNSFRVLENRFTTLRPGEPVSPSGGDTDTTQLTSVFYTEARFKLIEAAGVRAGKSDKQLRAQSVQMAMRLIKEAESRLLHIDMAQLEREAVEIEMAFDRSLARIEAGVQVLGKSRTATRFANDDSQPPMPSERTTALHARVEEAEDEGN